MLNFHSFRVKFSPKAPNDMIIKTGLASYGSSGLALHAPFIDSHPHFELTAVLERTKNLSKPRFPNSTTLRTYTELLENQELDLIVVNTPTQLHYQMAKDALLAGKHVVLEKPMATTYAQAKELVELAEGKNLVLAVYQNRRLESGFQTLKSVVDQELLGQLLYFKVHFNRDNPTIGPKAWKESTDLGGGMFYDLAPHLIDQALTLFGPPDSATCVFNQERPNTKVTDYFLITFNYAQGLVVELEAGMYIRKENEPKYVLKGQKGTYTKQHEDHQEYLLKQGIYPSKYDPDKGKIQYNTGLSDIIPNVKGGYSVFYENLYQTLTHQADLLIKPSEALQVMELMETLRTNA